MLCLLRGYVSSCFCVDSTSHEITLPAIYNSMKLHNQRVIACVSSSSVCVCVSVTYTVPWKEAWQLLQHNSFSNHRKHFSISQSEKPKSLFPKSVKGFCSSVSSLTAVTNPLFGNTKGYFTKKRCSLSHHQVGCCCFSVLCFESEGLWNWDRAVKWLVLLPHRKKVPGLNLRLSRNLFVKCFYMFYPILCFFNNSKSLWTALDLYNRSHRSPTVKNLCLVLVSNWNTKCNLIRVNSQTGLMIKNILVFVFFMKL